MATHSGWREDLRQFYRYTFYWVYAWSLRNYGRRDAPALRGVLIVSLCLYFNLLASGFFSGWLLHTTVIPNGLSKGVVIVVLLAFLFPQYVYFVRSGRYRAIAAEFDAWDADRRWYMNRRVIFYILGTGIAWILSLYLTREYPNPLHLPW